MFFIHIFYVLCFFVLTKSFCKLKNKKFKTEPNDLIYITTTLTLKQIF